MFFCRPEQSDFVVFIGFCFCCFYGFFGFEYFYGFFEFLNVGDFLFCFCRPGRSGFCYFSGVFGFAIFMSFLVLGILWVFEFFICFS